MISNFNLIALTFRDYLGQCPHSLNNNTEIQITEMIMWQMIFNSKT